MKKAAIYLTLFISLFITSCSINDNTPDVNITESDLIGDWKITNVYTENGKVSLNANGTTVSGDYSATGKDYNINMSFTDSPKKVSTSGSITIVATVTIAGQTQTQEESSGEIPNTTGEWSLKNNILTVKGTQETGELTIVKFENNSLVLKQALKASQSLGSLLNIKVTGEQYISLKKQ
ncbi:hypothetical protein [uncultured Tenacibaculum sp.]|uniref:hypothetical protein n=1 Tax=uncultured Tenacibaculum sp. TaxID=174713 RepID=UPI00261376FB|nr:hypothetical protein [uncultured Tenacibaculum sp.]